MADYESTISGSSIRGRYRDLEPTVAQNDPNKAFAPYMSLAPVTPLGHFELSVGSGAGGTGLPSLPSDAKRVVILSRDAELTYTDDGSAPSNTHGMIIPQNVRLIYDTDPDSNFKMWCPTASNVRIAYYG